MKKKFTLVTLGCRTNQYESEAYSYQLRQLGYTEAQEGDSADICIVNTCAVTAEAEKSSHQQIRKLHRLYPDSELVVTGCATGQIPDELRGVVHVVPNQDKERVLESLFPGQELPEFKIDQFAAHTRAFIKAQDGCNSCCSYCVIRIARGRSRSRPINEIVAEIQGLVRNGYKEVVLTGINIGDFEDGEGARLPDLVQAVDRIEGVERVRISSIDPQMVDDRLMEVILEGRSTAPSFHLSLQSGSNLTLKRMNRKYTKQQFLDKVEKLRAACPSFTFTTDVIVGFPGESDSDFEQTLEVMRTVRFAKVHMFPFSPRHGTRAALLPHPVSQEVMQERKQKVLRQAERDAFALRQSYLGKQLRLLTESPTFGHSENFLPVELVEPVGDNQLVTVECVDNRPDALVARCIG